MEMRLGRERQTGYDAWNQHRQKERETVEQQQEIIVDSSLYSFIKLVC